MAGAAAVPAAAASAGTPAGGLPLVVFVHGGGWQGGDKGAGRMLLPLVQSGEYAVASVGYRLTGEAIWPAQIHDCKAAIRWLRANAAAHGIDPGRIGVAALRGLLDGVRQAGVPEGRVVIDPSIARGLDYYTGIVLESFLDDLPALGSICSGGRYDNLAGLYTKQSLPGVGASLGIDRLLAGLEELGRLPLVETPAEVFLVHFDEAHLAEYLRIAGRLRADGMAVEFFPEAKRVGQQLKMAAKKGFRVALVIGSDEFAAGTAQLKNLATQVSSTIDWHGDVHVLSDAVHSQLEAMKAGG